MSVKDERELLQRMSSTSLCASNTDTLEKAWEELRLALEGWDSEGRRRAAAKAANYWRRLPIQEKGSWVRLLSGIWTAHYLQENQSEKLDLVVNRFLRQAERSGLTALRAEGLLAEGLSLLAAGKTKEAIEVWELSRALFSSTHLNSFDVIRSSVLLASAFRVVGDTRSALAVLFRAREKCLELEEIPLLGSVSLTLGLIHIEAGEFEEAIRCFTFTRISSEHLGSHKRALRASLGMAMVQLRTGDLSKAEATATEGLSLAKELQLPREICLAHELLGGVSLARSDWNNAIWQFSRMNKQATIAAATQDIGVELHRNLSEFWIKYGNWNRAARHVDKAKALASDVVGKEDCLALERLELIVKWGRDRDPEVAESLRLHSKKVHSLGYGFEHLLTCFDLVQLADSDNAPALAAEWWARVEFLAKSCGADPLLERWRKERQEKGYLPQTSPDGLDGEPGPHSRLAQELPSVDLAPHDIITRSRQLHEQASSICQVAPTTVPVLIHGESGTGKELFAKLVHNLSPRRSEVFLAINCGALPSELLESELFGHRRGSFTGAINDKAGFFRAAHKGTLFLDEIGEMTPAAQTKLLRVLEAGEVRRVGDTHVEFVDVRIVAATNVDLDREVRSGKFRQDLYYRLKGLEVFLPPLRERMSDIPLLADHFLTNANKVCHKQLVLPFETKQWLMGLPWLGNVRELRLAVERAAALGPESGMLQPYHFMRTEKPSSTSSLTDEMDEIERSRLLHALDACNWNKAAAAKLLGMSRTTLGGKIKRLGLEDTESKG